MSHSDRPDIAGAVVLVTGGAGFIGSHLVDGLLDAGAKQVVVIDNMFLGREENLADAIARGAVLYKDDAERASALAYIFDMHPIDIVFNCATKPLNYSFIDPGNCFACNVNITANLLDLQRAGRFKTLCHFSTSEVYGTAMYEPMDEKHPYDPHTPYAAGKLAADKMVTSYVRTFGLDAMIVRPFNNYGPRQNYRPPLEAVIPRTIRRICEGGAPEVQGDGKQSRDFILVGDTVNLVLKVYAKLPAGEEVNISAENEVAIGDLVAKVARRMDYAGPIDAKPPRAGDVQCHTATSAKLRTLIDYELTDFDAGLAQTIDWYVPLLQGSQS